MSKIIVPDDVLDCLLCDECHRYLSVKPIKVGVKRIILCGRCVDQKNKNFVNSYYGVFADDALFKCINHFDGCDKLLPYDKVTEHEKHCKSEEYDCLLCPEDVPKVPVYMLYRHVRTRHFNSLLSKNTFTVKLTHLKVNAFFHRIGNFLFFINESFNSNDNSILLCVIGVGKYFETSTLVTKFAISLEDKSVIDFQSETWSENNVMDMETNASKYTVGIDKAVENHTVTITFEIETPSYPLFVQTNSVLYPSNLEYEDELVSLFNSSSSRLREDSMILTLSKLIKNELSSVDHTGQTPCVWSRLLKLAPNSNSWHVSISSCETKLIINRFVNAKLEIISICFHCVLCKCICSKLTSNFVTKHGSLRHLVCPSCSVHVSKFTELIPLSSLLTNDIFSSIQYSCISKCRTYGSPSNNDNICSHYESTLSLETPCCMEDCEFQAASVTALVDHFKYSHNEDLTFLSENLMETIEVSLPPNASSKKIYILQYDVLIEVFLTFNAVSEQFYISAKICDNSKGDLNLLMHVSKEVDDKPEHLGTIFDREMALEPTVKQVLIRCFLL